jgi:hypothetical protein
VLTAGLQALGADLGGELMPARAGDNDKGYFENPDVVALNETLLSMDGSHWASLAYGAAIDFAAERYAEPRARARRILADRFGPGVIAIKDPRLCLTLPFWHQVIAQHRPHAPIFHVHLFRHPLDIAASFVRRARDGDTAHLSDLVGDDTHQILLLWLSYTYQALRNSRGGVNWCLQHPRLLSDPCAVLRELGTAIGMDVDGERLEAFGRDFVDAALVHHRACGPVASQHPELARIDPLWERLSALSGHLDDARHRALLDTFPDLEFAYLWSVQARHWLAERAHSARLAAELEAKQVAVDVREEKLKTLYAQRDALDADLRQAGAERQALAVELAAAQERQATTEHHLAAAQQRLDEQARLLDWLLPHRGLRKLYRLLAERARFGADTRRE